MCVKSFRQLLSRRKPLVGVIDRRWRSGGGARPFYRSAPISCLSTLLAPTPAVVNRSVDATGGLRNNNTTSGPTPRACPTSPPQLVAGLVVDVDVTPERTEPSLLIPTAASFQTVNHFLLAQATLNNANGEYKRASRKFTGPASSHHVATREHFLKRAALPQISCSRRLLWPKHRVCSADRSYLDELRSLTIN